MHVEQVECLLPLVVLVVVVVVVVVVAGLCGVRHIHTAVAGSSFFQMFLDFLRRIVRTCMCRSRAKNTRKNTVRQL